MNEGENHKTKKGNKMLMIIDPQIDFISGSLPVPGAENAMNALAEFIRTNGRDYTHIVVTADRHPMCHCSFREEGGDWPRHCVADSVGAAIWPVLMAELLAMANKVTVVHKGEDATREEYSIFKNAAATKRILDIIKAENISRTDICGLAGDVCVADTIRDAIGLLPATQLRVLPDYSPSLDGGRTLRTLIAHLPKTQI